MKQKILSLLLVFCCFQLFAQERTITGTIYDSGGAPLSGVSVALKGTNVATQSSGAGSYSIDAETGAVLVFSYIGTVTQEITVGQNSTINVTMVATSSDLDEVVVVGYGTQSRRKSTDNIARIGSAQISEIPSPAFQNTLAGKAAGVQITQTNGKVEGGVRMRIRGVGSVSAGSEPLYVLDGMPLINQNESNNTAPQNPLLTLSPNEIESIDILKDASAVAIYGSRGANGVVIITTKRGKAGSNISANISHGFSSPTHLREWLNAEEYMELFTEAAINTYGQEDGLDEAEGLFDWLAQGADWRNGEVNTDWQDLAFQNGYVTDGDLSFSGGNDKTTYFFSGAYNNTKGIIRGNNLDRITSRVNVSHRFTDKLTAGANLAFSRTGIDRIANDNAFVTPLQSVAQPPISPAFLPDGEPNNQTLYPNYLLEDKYGFYNTNIRRVTGKAYGEYRFLPYLKFNTDFGYDLYYQTEDQFRGSLTPDGMSTNGSGYSSTVGTESYITSNYFTFDQRWSGNHELNAVAGMEYNDTRRRFQSVTGIQFPSDDLQTISSAAEITGGSGSMTPYNFLSYFARANYSFMDRYLFKASIRRDGSSRFADGFRYGTFASVAAGWIISEEDFLKDANTLSFLKLRGSWGQSGNAEINDFTYMGLYQGVAYRQLPGIYPSQPANSLLTWESMDQVDVGIDYGFLDNRISGEIDYYVKKSDGLLFNVPLPGTSGFSSMTRNIGVMENKGFEFTINTENIKKERFTWNTNLNLATNKNRIVDLPDGEDVITGQNILREGESINAFYLVEYAGVDPANGDALYYLNTPDESGSLNSETTNNYNSANRIVTGSPIPTLIGGFTNTLAYKEFDFSFTLQGEWGASIYNSGGRFQSNNMLYEDNQTRDQLRRWQNPGDITDVPQARLYVNNGAGHSTRYLEKADFIRLRNVNLGYTLPQSVVNQMGLSRVRIYFTAINLLTFTNFDGYDPEARSDIGAAAAGLGETFYSAPQARTFSFGLNVNF